MKPIQDCFEKLIRKWLHDDFRNPQSELYIATLTTENFAKIIKSASEQMVKVIHEELDAARKWYAAEERRLADEILLADPIKRAEYHSDLEKEWQEIQKECAQYANEPEDWYKR